MVKLHNAEAKTSWANAVKMGLSPPILSKLYKLQLRYLVQKLLKLKKRIKVS